MKLLMTHGKPIKAASRGTIHRWTTEVLIRSGVDMTIYMPHSTRLASTSKVASKLKLATILKTAGWAKESMFRKYYKKPVDRKYEFGEAVVT